MRIALFLGLLMSATPLCAASLEFDSMLKEVHLAADADEVTMEFHFENKSDREVVIQKADVPCNCMQVTIQGGKLNYEPRAKGIIRVRYDMKTFTGTVDKSVMLYVDKDPKDEPSFILTTRIHIPVLIETDPKPVKWLLGEEPKEKIVTITMKHSDPIRVLRVTGMADGMRYELRTVEEGRIYQLAITPKDTKVPALATFRIETDCAIEKHRVQQVFAVIRREARN